LDTYFFFLGRDLGVRGFKGYDMGGMVHQDLDGAHTTLSSGYAFIFPLLRHELMK
jgi:hypothetical protein